MVCLLIEAVVIRLAILVDVLISLVDNGRSGGRRGSSDATTLCLSQSSFIEPRVMFSNCFKAYVRKKLREIASREGVSTRQGEVPTAVAFSERHDGAVDVQHAQTAIEHGFVDDLLRDESLNAIHTAHDECELLLEQGYLVLLPARLVDRLRNSFSLLTPPLWVPRSHIAIHWPRVARIVSVHLTRRL